MSFNKKSRLIHCTISKKCLVLFLMVRKVQTYFLSLISNWKKSANCSSINPFSILWLSLCRLRKCFIANQFELLCELNFYAWSVLAFYCKSVSIEPSLKLKSMLQIHFQLVVNLLIKIAFRIVQWFKTFLPNSVFGAMNKYLFLSCIALHW